MGSNKLAVLDRTLPLRAFPEKDLNRVLLMEFLPYITKLLSLTDEVSADRLEMALPAIKEQCIGMGFAEIKKMFEMYADNKLSIKPIPNYFDRILLGKIVSEYKQRNKKPIVMKETEKTDEEKEFIMDEAIDRLQKEYKFNKKITSVCIHVYDYLFKKGSLPEHTKEFKDRIYQQAKIIAKSEVMTQSVSDYNIHRKLKSMLEKIEKGKSNIVVPIAKRIVLEGYFKI